MKFCPHCKTSKELSEFCKDKNTKCGLSSWCKKCKNANLRARHDNIPGYTLRCGLKSQFGLTPEDVERMFVEQDGKCDSCGDAISLIPGDPTYRQIDHDHAKQKGDPGFIRSLLCGHCNSMLGYARDNALRLLKGADYLRRLYVQSK